MADTKSLPMIDLAGSLKSGVAASEWMRMLIRRAIKDGLPIEVVDVSGLKKSVTRIPSGLEAQIGEVAEKKGITFGEAFASLAQAGLRAEMADRQGSAGAPAAQPKPIPAPPFTPRSPQQATYYRNIMQGLLEKKVIMAEASTGVGKSRAFLGAALRLAQSGVRPIVVAAPSLAVLRHLEAEWRGLDAGAISARWLAGASEFVNAQALLDYIDAAQARNEAGDEEGNEESNEESNGEGNGEGAMPLDAAVVEWAHSGAPALDPESAMARSIGADAAWLMDDLRALAKSMPTEDFALRSDETDLSDAGKQMLERLRESARAEGDVIFCTHSMLALNAKIGWSVLPRPAALFVDEAHLFEAVAANIFSDQLSFFRLRSDVTRFCRENGKGSTVATAVSRAVKATVKLLRAADNGAGSGMVRLATGCQVNLAALHEKLAAMTKALDSKLLKTMPRLDKYRHILRRISETISGAKTNNAALLSFSPEIRLPSLAYGPADIRPLLGRIWEAASEGVVLASATLFVPDASGVSRCDFIRANLGAPGGARLVTPVPVVSQEIYRDPEMHIPGRETAQKLIPPSAAFPAVNPDTWAENMAQQIAQVARSAAGGTLVLMTSFQAAKQIEEKLLQHNVQEQRLIVQSSRLSLRECTAAFRARHAAGLRPVMIGVGTAWTGLDLSDPSVAAEYDMLLTDLVIGRLPVALSRSTVSEMRLSRMGTHAASMEAMLSLKQGLGRLIRRSGLKRRRIWVMDGRIDISVNWPGMNELTVAARRLLRNYTNRKSF